MPERMPAHLTGEAPVDIARLYRQYSGWLVRRVRGRYSHGADDLVQETYLRIAMYIPTGEIPQPKALLLKIASNLARDWAAKDRRHLSAGHRCDHVCSNEGETAILLEQIILGLPEGLRDVFVMSRFGGLSNAQIAERLGISPKTVEWRMTKALAHCAAQLR